jgi:hypothetical protein
MSTCMRWVGIIGLPRRATPIVTLGLPLRALEAASKAAAARELAASKRTTPVAPAVRSRRVLGGRPCRGVRWRMRLA